MIEQNEVDKKKKELEKLTNKEVMTYSSITNFGIEIVKNRLFEAL